MTAPGLAVFATPIGICGIAWGERGIAAVGLPERSEAALRARLRRRVPGAVEQVPPPEVQRAIDGIVALLRGEAADLSAVPLDMQDLSALDRQVYAVARKIPPGRTLTYGEIAARLGDPALAREVGAALGKNPFPLVVPCHRVLAAGGRPGGFSARGGLATKLRLLELEGARVGSEPTLFAKLPLMAPPRQRRPSGGRA
jgi:methylated-DNA-[protein]-cysteine S-methyltransferase